MKVMRQSISTYIRHKERQKPINFLKKLSSRPSSIKKLHKKLLKRNQCSLQICRMRFEHHLMVLLDLPNYLKIQGLKRSKVNLLRLSKNHQRTFLKLSTIFLTSLKSNLINLRLKILSLIQSKSLSQLLKFMQYVQVKNTLTLDVSSILNLSSLLKEIRQKLKKLSLTFSLMRSNLQVAQVPSM